MTQARRILLHPAYLLHSRAYRDTSLIIDIFTEEYGRVALVARGAKRPKSQWQSLLQPFRRLLVSWTARSDLGTLVSAENAAPPSWLKGAALISGFYSNELLMRLLHRDDPHPELFACYAALQADLQSISRLPVVTGQDKTRRHGVERALRIFEKNALRELGYGLILEQDVRSGLAVEAQRLYCYYPEEGPVAGRRAVGESVIMHGSSLLSLSRENLDDELSLHEAKKLMRMILGRRLGDRPLHSRQLFRSDS